MFKSLLKNLSQISLSCKDDWKFECYGKMGQLRVNEFSHFFGRWQRFIGTSVDNKKKYFYSITHAICHDFVKMV